MSTPTRKRSLSGPSVSVKKKKYNCKFQADWMKDFQFLRPSSLGNEFEKIRSLCALLFGRTTHARANLDKLGYLGCFENNSFISHIEKGKNSLYRL
jgi:hypothetical protein